jgi:hypothetical protein
MFLMEMNNFQKSDDKVHKKIWASTEEMLDEAGDDDIPIDEIRKENIRIFKVKENILSSTRSRPISPVRRCRIVLVDPSIESILMVRDVISTRVLFMPPTLRRPGLF